MNLRVFLIICGLTAAASLTMVVVDHVREPTFAADRPAWPDGRPVTVGVLGALQIFDDDINAAIAEVNRQAKCPVFSRGGGSSQVVMMFLDTEPCHGRGKPLQRQHTEGTWDCKDGTVEIQFDDLAHPANRYPRILHALGHAAGLAHDTSGTSVMRDPPPPMGRPAPALTSKDADALAQKHCR